MISTFDSLALLSSPFQMGIIVNSERRGLCSNTHSRGYDLRLCVIYNDDEQRRDPGTVFGSAVSELTKAMRMIEIAIGIILLGGAAWTTVRTYRGRGISSILVLAFAVFLVALGLSFLFGAFGELVRNLRFGSEWLK